MVKFLIFDSPFTYNRVQGRPSQEIFKVTPLQDERVILQGSFEDPEGHGAPTCSHSDLMDTREDFQRRHAYVEGIDVILLDEPAKRLCQTD